MGSAQKNVILCFGSFACLGGTRALLSGKVILGKSLFPGLGLPVVIPNTTASFDDAAAKLSEHGTGCDNGNLPRAIGEGQNLLLDKIILFSLAGNDFEKRPILVKKQIRVSVSQDASAFGGKHEELISAIGYEERPASVLAAA
jgi:hypothetical protein